MTVEMAVFEVDSGAAAVERCEADLDLAPVALPALSGGAEARGLVHQPLGQNGVVHRPLKGFRSPDGEKLVLDENLFVEAVLRVPSRAG